MFDEAGRRLKNYLLTTPAQAITFVSPSQISLIGLLFGIGAFFALWQQLYGIGIVLWLFNRILDGLDGVVAREHQLQSDFGGYVDIICDYIAYTLIPIGVIAGAPSDVRWIALVFLLAMFYVNSASWMYLAAILEKRSAGASANNETTTITMPRGLVAGGETIIFFTLFILAPQYAEYLFLLMGTMIGIGIVQRLIWARSALAE